MKYVIGEGVVFKVDEDNEIKILDKTYIAINRYFIVPEDGEINGVPVNKGDVICTLYGQKEDNFIVITDPKAKKLAQEEFYRRNKQIEEDVFVPEQAA